LEYIPRGFHVEAEEKGTNRSEVAIHVAEDQVVNLVVMAK
jgi:hypothetical protein